MTKDEKKEFFISIIETWFDDKSEKINSENCIGFYNYFIDCLEFEVGFSPEYEPGFHIVLDIVVDLLINFPSYVDKDILGRIGLKNFIINSDKTANIKNIEALLIKLEEFFVMFRDEYLM